MLLWHGLLCSCLYQFSIFLLAFIWVNRHLPYSRLIGLGSLNCLVILLNKGTMPLAPAYLNLNRAKLSYDFLVNGNLPLYHIIDENTVLWFLGTLSEFHIRFLHS